MSKRDILIFIFKWKYSLIGYFLLIVALVTALLYVMPIKYPSTARIIIEANASPTMHSSPVLGRVDPLGVIYTELEILLSRSVLASAVDQVRPHHRPKVLSKLWAMINAARSVFEEIGLVEPISDRDRWIRRLGKKLKVEPIESSAVIDITFEDGDPKWAARIVNAVVDSFIDHHLRIFSSPGTVNLYRGQLERIVGELEQQRAALQVLRGDDSGAAIEHRKRSLVEQQSRLTAQLNSARVHLAKLLTKYVQGHKDVKLEKKKLNGLEALIHETEEELRQVEMQDVRINELETKIAVTEQSYRKLKTQFDAAQLNELANPDVVNVRVMEYGDVPRRPARSRLFYIVVSAFCALLFSVTIAFIREYLDNRVTDVNVAEQILGVPALGSIERV